MKSNFIKNVLPINSQKSLYLAVKLITKDLDKDRMDLKSKISTEQLPLHVAIIMDGNGRWAKKQGEERVFGHQSGVTSVRETVECAAELGIKFLTLYAFSTENWNRPKEEVDALMSLLVNTISAETKTLMDNKIKLNAIGNIDSLPEDCKAELQTAIDTTANNDRMTLSLALSYSAKWEIIEEKHIDQYLTTAGIPDPELMIRTSGEHRISNFLLWQLAYAEFHFTEVLWPDFRKDDFYTAIIDYQNRERRFGKTSDQLMNFLSQ
jgi:undecaprenyl diphosphate synthase